MAIISRLFPGTALLRFNTGKTNSFRVPPVSWDGIVAVVKAVMITGRRIFSAVRLPCIAGCKTGGHIFSRVFSGNAILKNSLHNTSLIFYPLPG